MNKSSVEKNQEFRRDIREKVWPVSKGDGITIGILDTGVDFSNPALQNNFIKDSQGTILAQRIITDEVTYCGPQTIQDSNGNDDEGHGTHVAGIITGVDPLCDFEDPEKECLHGVAPECKIIPCKILNASGRGTLEDIVEGTKWLVEQGCDIINMSLGSQGVQFIDGVDIFKQIVQDAVKQGVIIVAAAGNDDTNDPNNPNFGATIDYPAKYEGTISVGAVDEEHTTKAFFSSRGDQLDIMAPGWRVLSLGLFGAQIPSSGTSMATPFIAGICALIQGARIKQGKPKFTPKQMLNFLTKESNTIDLEDDGFDRKTGYGLIKVSEGLTTFTEEDEIDDKFPFEEDGEGSTSKIVKVSSLWHKPLNNTDSIVNKIYNKIVGFMDTFLSKQN